MLDNQVQAQRQMLKSKVVNTLSLEAMSTIVCTVTHVGNAHAVSFVALVYQLHPSLVAGCLLGLFLPSFPASDLFVKAPTSSSPIIKMLPPNLVHATSCGRVFVHSRVQVAGPVVVVWILALPFLHCRTFCLHLPTSCPGKLHPVPMSGQLDWRRCGFLPPFTIIPNVLLSCLRPPERSSPSHPFSQY